MAEFENHGFTDWAASAPPPLPPPPPAPAALAPLFDLRPLSTGEILDRTFTLYRQRFWVYVGLSSVAAGITTLGTFLRLTFSSQLALGTVGQPAATAGLGKQALILLSLVYAQLFVYLIAYSITQAATVSAVSDAYLGNETSLSSAFRVARRHWMRYILITVWQYWSAFWVPFTLVFLGAIAAALLARAGFEWITAIIFLSAFVGLIYGVIAFLRNSLGIASSVVEDLKVRKAMKRSKFLVAGHKGRLFGLFVLLLILQMVAGAAQGVVAVFLTIAKGGVAHVLVEILTLVTTFVTGSLVAPIGAIALCLFYVDERVRKEGFDIETLMNRGMAGGAGSGAKVAEITGSPFSSELA